MDRLDRVESQLENQIKNRISSSDTVRQIKLVMVNSNKFCRHNKYRRGKNPRK